MRRTKQRGSHGNSHPWAKTKGFSCPGLPQTISPLRHRIPRASGPNPSRHNLWQEPFSIWTCEEESPRKLVRGYPLQIGKAWPLPNPIPTFPHLAHPAQAISISRWFPFSGAAAQVLRMSPQDDVNRRFKLARAKVESQRLFCLDSGLREIESRDHAEGVVFLPRCCRCEIHWQDLQTEKGRPAGALSRLEFQPEQMG